MKMILALTAGFSALLAILIYELYNRFVKRKMYYRKGNEVKVPIEYNPQDEVIIVQEKEFSTSIPLAAEALEDGFAKGWQMDDGILLELELVQSKDSKFLEEVATGISIRGVDVISTVERMRKSLVIDRRLNKLVSRMETCLMIAIAVGVFSLVAFCLLP